MPFISCFSLVLLRNAITWKIWIFIWVQTIMRKEKLQEIMTSLHEKVESKRDLEMEKSHFFYKENTTKK